MGVFLPRRRSPATDQGLPHARGGVSPPSTARTPRARSSPRTWGCFSLSETTRHGPHVFPTHVGVFPMVRGERRVRYCLPHARGGVSMTITAANCTLLSSPRTWGCFLLTLLTLPGRAVFPTHVGVFLQTVYGLSDAYGLPHARGGVSGTGGRIPGHGSSSPRTWGCFQVTLAGISGPPVFPTHVGVFLFLHVIAIRCWRLPHARGGVSTGSPPARADATSSPRTWGCFSMKLIGLDTEGVFPTHVGVFPAQQATDTPDRRLPHARGGVSTIYGASSTVMPSSPRTWGCFFSSGAVSMTRFVFPTHVGVFLKKPVGKRIRRRLPHARGGVSWLSLLFPP